MDINNYEDYSEETAIRNGWRIAFYAHIGMSFLLILGTGWWDLLLYMWAREAIFMLLLYHFAYKKGGIKFLLWIMICGTISYIASTIYAIKSTMSGTARYDHWLIYPIIGTFFLVPTLIEVYFFFNCYQLLKLNWRIKKRVSAS